MMESRVTRYTSGKLILNRSKKDDGQFECLLTARECKDVDKKETSERIIHNN